jgi:hypothetical protein
MPVLMGAGQLTEFPALKDPSSDQWRQKAQFYHMSLTRDTGTMRTLLSHSNCLYRGGILFGQAYNLNKNLFSTPIKALRPFQSPHLEGLPLCDKLLQEWYDVSRVGAGHPRRRANLNRSFLATKRRLHHTWRDRSRSRSRHCRSLRHFDTAPSPPP